MYKLTYSLFLLLGGLASAMTPQEFKTLYESKDKTADVCYQLYQAYNKGDGVEEDKSQARKWLLAAHGSGKLSTRKEVCSQPWRKKAKLKPSIEIEEVSDEEAASLGRELVQFMLDNGGRQRVGMNGLPENKPSRELVAGVRKYIAQGADLNLCVREQNDMYVFTALYLACKLGDESLMDLLINHGADPNFHGGLAMEAFFMPARPKMDMANMAGVPAGVSGSMAREIRKSVKRTSKGKSGEDKRVQKLFTHLVKKGADVNMWSNVGWSPVFTAVNANSPFGVQMLVKAGADPNQKQNPHEVANHTLSAQRINYLTKGFGVDEEETPLNSAATYAKADVAEALLKAGATPGLSNAKGQTPAKIAKDLKKKLEAKPAHERNPEMEKNTQAILKLLKA